MGLEKLRPEEESGTWVWKSSGQRKSVASGLGKAHVEVFTFWKRCASKVAMKYVLGLLHLSTTINIYFPKTISGVVTNLA